MCAQRCARAVVRALAQPLVPSPMACRLRAGTMRTRAARRSRASSIAACTRSPISSRALAPGGTRRSDAEKMARVGFRKCCAVANTVPTSNMDGRASLDIGRASLDKCVWDIAVASRFYIGILIFRPDVERQRGLHTDTADTRNTRTRRALYTRSSRIATVPRYRYRAVLEFPNRRDRPSAPAR